MTNSLPQLVARAVLPVLALVLLGACRDTLNHTPLTPTPRLQPTAQLVLEPRTAGDSTLSVSIRVTGVQPPEIPSPRLASVTAAVVYDTTRIRFVQDASPGDGALRAAHASRGRVMVAAAHATGFTGDVIARLRFVARDPDAHMTLSLQVTEIHLVDATDLRGRLIILPLVVTR